MGSYLNPGSTAFQGSLRSQIYIDKSGLIEKTNTVLGTEQKYVCVSRPRRFGKSMAANMLAAYYDRDCDTKEFFDKLKISQSEEYLKHLNQYDVLKINMQEFLSATQSMEEMLRLLQKRLITDLKNRYSSYEIEDNLVFAMQDVYANTHHPFIILIDEWDCLFREYQQDKDAHKKYLDFLRFWLKDKDYIALAYMTGILPIKKYGSHSALNMFMEYSMTDPGELAEFFGFTEEEVQSLCVSYGMPYDRMKQWYDGYDLKGIQIYNPRSVVMSLLGHDFDSYWTKTETYEALKKYIQMDMYHLKALVTQLISGSRIRINPDKFQNDMSTFASVDDVFTLLVHLGYLTYDFENKTVSIPNQEVQKEFINCIEDGGWEPVMDAIRNSKALLQATIDGKEEYVAEMIEQVHQENISILKYNDENSMSCVLSLAYYAARKDYVMYRELAGGKGFADIVFVPRKFRDVPAIVVELKWDKSSDAAIAQIKKKQYMQSLKDYHGQVILAGINYDSTDSTKDDYKRHSCSIEKINL